MRQIERITQETEDIGTALAAEGAGDLLVDFDRKKIALRLIAIERDGETLEESERRVLVGSKAIEQVAHRALIAPRSAAGPWKKKAGRQRQPRIVDHVLGQQRCHAAGAEATLAC